VRLDPPRNCWRDWAAGVGLGNRDGVEPRVSRARPIRCISSDGRYRAMAAVSALLVNLLVSWLLTVILRATVGMSAQG